MSQIPSWFSSALARQPVLDAVDVDGAVVRYRQWGEPGERDIVLVHGGAAHSRWWDHIGPLLATNGRVVAVDLSGHGDSDHRPSYSLQKWGTEVLMAGAAAGLTEPTVIGHSMGGLVTLALLQAPQSGVTHAIMIDSPVDSADADARPESPELSTRQSRIYASEAEAISRFRPVPAQSSIPAIADHIARTSYREVAGGFSWKFDPQIFAGDDLLQTEWSTISGELVFFRAEHGLEASDARSTVEGAGGQFIEIPEAGHAPMLDQPLALVTGIRAVFAGWEHAR